MNMEPCAIHEMWPCGICNGAEKRFNESLKPEVDLSDRGVLGRGVVRARFATRCAGCRRDIVIGELIAMAGDGSGWVALDCCGDAR